MRVMRIMRGRWFTVESEKTISTAPSVDFGRQASMSPLRSLLTLLLALLLSLLLAVATALPLPAFAQLKEVPALTTRVTDQAGMLDESQRQRLEAVLGEYEQKTGSQIAVLLVKSTEPEAIEQYSIRVTDAWQLGRKGIDDGVLLVVARDNPSALRRLRIEAGRGVQGVLTDVQSKRILQDTIAPHFRQAHYYEGLVAGVGAIATLLNRELLPAPAQPAPQQGEASDGGDFLLLGIFAALIGIFVLLIIFFVVRSKFRRYRSNWLRDNPGLVNRGAIVLYFILEGILNAIFSGGGDRSRSRSGRSRGVSGGGGSFDGGGASGDW